MHSRHFSCITYAKCYVLPSPCSYLAHSAVPKLHSLPKWNAKSSAKPLKALSESTRELSPTCDQALQRSPSMRESSERESRYGHRCLRDSNGRIRRSAVARSEFRRDNPCPATGLTRGACRGYM